MANAILKTPQEIEAMRPANEVVAQALKLMQEMVAPGITTRELDQAAEDVIRKAGGIPAFKDYPNPAPGAPAFPATICASVNEEVVHGIPGGRVLKEGDIISIDVGAEINGFFGDAARTFPVGTVSRKAAKLLKIGAESLEMGRREFRVGRKMKDMSHAIQEKAESNGFSVVKQFVGHGIGRAMHEPPQVPNYVSRGFRENSIAFEPGMVLAVEPMVNAGKSDVLVLSDGWTVVTKDRQLSVHFENTMALTENGLLVLTDY